MEKETKEAIEEAERFLELLREQSFIPKKKVSKYKALEKKASVSTSTKNRATVEVFDDASPDVTPREQFSLPSKSRGSTSKSLEDPFATTKEFGGSRSSTSKSRLMKTTESLPSLVPKGKKSEANRSKSAMSSQTPGDVKSELINNITTVLQQSRKHDDEDPSAVRDELTQALGVGDIDPPEHMTAPDGSFKPQLRTTVLNALLESRFDSVATLMADTTWKENNDRQDIFEDTTRMFSRAATAAGTLEGASLKPKPFLTPKRVATPSMQAIAKHVDTSRKPFVAMLKQLDGGKKRAQTTGAIPTEQGLEDTTTMEGVETIQNPSDLTLCEISHPGLASSTQREMAPTTAFDPSTMCFGCWSAGVKRKCTLHEDKTSKLKPSQTMLLCRNWDLGVMRRRYRSEEIQEIFLKKSTSLRYDAKRKKFNTVVEQRHPVYRTLTNLLNRFNSTVLVFIKAKRWLFSIADAVCVGKVKSTKVAKKSAQMRWKRSVSNRQRITRYSRRVRGLLPVGPITGTSFPELKGWIQYLFQHKDLATGETVDLIRADPVPVPKKLYEPREYFLAVPKSIPMPSAATSKGLTMSTDRYSVGTPSTNSGFRSPTAMSSHSKRSSSPMKPAAIPTTNEFFDSTSNLAWFERLCSSLTQYSIKSASTQISAITPMKGLELLRRTKQPPPSTIKFATLGRKRCPGNIAVGGLAVEFLVYQLVSTFFPAQYGSLVATEQSIVSPGVSPETNIVFQSLLMGPVLQPYILRPVEHPLNYRKSPTITVNSLIEPHMKDYYGANRPEQTGEQEAHGFRTSTWTYHLVAIEETEAIVFTPGPEVVSLNGTAANRSVTTHADSTYPFCEPSTKDNSTLDFYHLLLTGYLSPNKAQVFTALTVQEPGQFQRECKTHLPMGHLVVAVYRSWAFTQKDTIQEFKTDDGVSYWYHHRTGQTFWERPLYEEEKVSVLEGGLTLDMDHPEEPLLVHRGQEGGERRYLQGEFRKQMLTHHENMTEASKRRRSASLAAGIARERGFLPAGASPAMALDMASKMVNPNASSSQVFDATALATGKSSAGAANASTATTAHASTDYEVLNLQTLPTSQNLFPSRPGTYASPSRGDRTASHGDTSPQGSIDSHESSESCIVNDQGVRMSMRPPSQQHSGSAGSGARMTASTAHGVRKGSQLDFIEENEDIEMGPIAPVPRSQMTTGAMVDQLQQANMAGIPGFAAFEKVGQAGVANAGLDPNMMMALTQTMGKMMAAMVDAASPQEMLQMGLGMGIALMQSNAVKDLVVTTTAAKETDEIKRKGKMTYAEIQAEAEAAANTHSSSSSALVVGAGSSRGGGGDVPMIPAMIGMAAPEEDKVGAKYDTNVHPIGLSKPNQILTSKKPLDHAEEQAAAARHKDLVDVPLTAYENARDIKVHYALPSETPDEAPPKHLTDCYSMTKDEALREQYPVLVYPELSTQTEGGAPPEAATHPAAGVGTSFVRKTDGDKQTFVRGSSVLRKAAMPLPVGFFDAICAKHVATQFVDYLPQVPNLPLSRTVGRVKPRSAAVDWMAVNFDPWSAGKNPLSVEFVNSLATKAETLFDKAGSSAKALEEMEALREAVVPGVVVDVVDGQGLAQQRAEISKNQMLMADFKKVCSLARHSKFSEVEQLLNQPDWNVPIDFQDEHGNALIHICGQNGNKRLMKLCLRRGANLDIQNLNGNTALHFLFAYGHEELGNYLIKKGADNSIRNKDNLTCYEGLSAKELNQL